MMDSWTFNKIAGAVLGTCLLVIGLGTIAGAVYHHEAPSAESPAFKIEVAEAAAGGEAAGGAAAAVSVGTLLATADAAKGAAEAKACAACHDMSQANTNKTGPGLWDVVERQIASHAGFAYSPGALEKAADKWSYENLNTFLQNPKGFIKGTKMAFGGVKNDKKRADLLAYLASLSAAPKPFPPP
jgi:cytochrome c